MNPLCMTFAGVAFSLICSLASSPQSSCWAQSKEPVLSLETGTHTGRITALDADSSGRLLVTTATDKTARVWDISRGEEPVLLNTLRPPIGPGMEGKLYAVAISPDARTVACAGQTGRSWEGETSIYLFDPTTGQLLKRLKGQRSTVHHLAFSPEGRLLAAILFKGGIRLFNSEGELIAKDEHYETKGMRACFNASGSLLATSSMDGLVRVYEIKDLWGQRGAVLDIRPVSTFRPQAGRVPVGISFSPDGSKLAVGFQDIAKVEVLELRTTTLSHGFVPDCSGMGRSRNLTLVAWSRDGRHLFAAGGYASKGVWQIRRWDRGGRGDYIDMPAGQGPVSDLVSLPSGDMAFSTYEPATFGILDASGRRRLIKESPIANHRSNQDNLLISPDGWTVQFAFEAMGKAPCVFSVPERNLSDLTYSLLGGIKSALTMSAPVTEGTGVTDWKGSTSPKLDGKPLQIPAGGLSRSMVVLPDLSGFILGTDWSLTRYDRSGKIIWSVPVNCAFAVNTNGRVVVGAMGDGTIRWYRVSDGLELLALFPHKDRKRWILWTPSGYYHSSPGGEDLIGWHVNRGKDREGDFFPASRFRSMYARPDVIDSIYVTLDEKEALLAANRESGRQEIQPPSLEEKLPPVVRILSPLDNTEISSPAVRISYSASSQEPLTGLRVMIDGRPALKVDDSSKIKSSGELTLSVPARDLELSLIAENRHAPSEPATIRLRWRGAAAKEEFQIKPKLYILAVGVSQYQDEGLRLGFAAKDALDFGKLWQQQGVMYAGVEARILTDAQATKGNILDGLEWLQRQVTQKDVAILFFAGHGINDPNGMFYFLPVDADIEKLKRTGISQADITSTVATLAGKVLVFMDACHSGNLMGKLKRRAALDVTSVINELASAENGAIVFSSATGRQYSLENPDWRNGAFTLALLEGIRGKADFRGSGRITVNMLDLYVSERVKELTEGKQTPTTVKPPNVPDFPVALRR
ncbi:MAG: caspase family protein [bacterium]